MYISATTQCFPNASLSEAVDALAEQEFGYLETFIYEQGGAIKPSDVLNHFDEVAALFRGITRMTPSVFSIDIPSEQNFKAQFKACCKLAKVNGIVSLALRSSPLGFPFNEEIERLEYAVEEAFTAGCVVSVLTEKGRISEDLQTTLGFCNRIHGLMVALDPSYYLGEAMQSKMMESLLPFVNHVRLRDSKPGVYQTKVGQGDFEFGKLINQLDKVGYKRALSIDIVPQEGADHLVELRKMRMLLESLVL
ncbi:MAG: sugar phosphate isomerase/epimerase [Thermoguttaceae bacterium]|nr:sugar phosphate isomerase/epimerase [Thermoguttaceae bacterium]